MKRCVVGAFALSAFFLTGLAEVDAGGKKPALKCPVKGKPAKKTVSAKHNGGTVYFC